MSIQQEAAGAIGTVVEGLKGSPALLMLIVLVALVFGLTAWSIQKNQDRQHQIVQLLLDKCLPQARVEAPAAFGDITSSVLPASGPRATDVPWWMPVKGTKP